MHYHGEKSTILYFKDITHIFQKTQLSILLSHELLL